MNKLYIVEALGGDREKSVVVSFRAIEIEEETENEYIFTDSFKSSNQEYKNKFPKKLINKELEYLFVTNKKNKRTIEKQIKRIHDEINTGHKIKIEYYEELIRRNEEAYKSSVELLDNIK